MTYWGAKLAVVVVVLEMAASVLEARVLWFALEHDREYTELGYFNVISTATHAIARTNS